MRRAPNMRISQWHRLLRSSDWWTDRANCAEHRYRTLPWADDHQPSTPDRVEMEQVCSDCPVRRDCARYAIENAAGGFYAGVWLPWASDSRIDRERRRVSIAALCSLLVPTAVS